MSKNNLPPPMQYAKGVLTLSLRVQPGASTTEMAGQYGEQALRLRLAAPPVDGKANRECIRFLAETLAVPTLAVSLLRGETSRDKVLRIEGVSEQAFLSLQAQWRS